MELRMYGLSNYQLTGIQKGIQFLHGVVEYSQKANRIGGDILDIYNDWANNYKTVILLNGGTTNSRYDSKTGMPFGTLNNHVLTLIENNIEHATFSEPDLGDQLTSVVFIVDERVFNKEKYPDFDLKKIYGDFKIKLNEVFEDPMDPKFPNSYDLNGIDIRKQWEDWIVSIGGEKNVFLRTFLKNFKLA